MAGAVCCPSRTRCEAEAAAEPETRVAVQTAEVVAAAAGSPQVATPRLRRYLHGIKPGSSTVLLAQELNAHSEVHSTKY